MENLVQMFFVKAHEWSSSYGIEIIHLTHIQYMNKYFILYIAIYCYKCYILTNTLFNHLLLIKIYKFF
jgi:hypothetical protein